MENVKINENESIEYDEKNKLATYEHNDIVFFKHKEKNKIGIGRIVNFYTELKLNDIFLSSEHKVSLANYTKILNNLSDGKYVQNYIDNLRNQNTTITSKQVSNTNTNDTKSNCNLYEKEEEKQSYNYFNINEKDKESEIHVSTKTEINKTTNPEFKHGIKIRHRKKKDYSNDSSLLRSNSISSCVTRKNDEKRKSSKMFYIVQSFESYKYILQYKKVFKHYKIFIHKKWEIIKSSFCKSIQNKVCFVLAMKLFEVKKLYPNNTNLQNIMINNLMKIYKSERDLHIDHLVLNFIKKIDVRIILQNSVLITNDDFNEIISKDKKEKEEDTQSKYPYTNTLDSHNDDSEKIEQEGILQSWSLQKKSFTPNKLKHYYHNYNETSDQKINEQSDQSSIIHDSIADNYNKFHIDYGKKHPINYFQHDNEQGNDSEMLKRNNNSIQECVKRRKVIEGETFQYELKGNLLAKFKSPKGVLYRRCIKSIYKNKNNILSYFLITPSFFWFNDSYYFSCLNIDMDIFELLEIIKIIDDSKKEQIENISFEKYKSLRKIYNCTSNPNINETNNLLRKNSAENNVPIKIEVPTSKRGRKKKNRKERKRNNLQAKIQKRNENELSEDDNLKPNGSREKIRRRMKKRKRGQEESFLDSKSAKDEKIKRRKKLVEKQEVKEKKRRGRKKKVVSLQNGENTQEHKETENIEEIKELTELKNMEEHKEAENIEDTKEHTEPKNMEKHEEAGNTEETKEYRESQNVQEGVTQKENEMEIHDECKSKILAINETKAQNSEFDSKGEKNSFFKEKNSLQNNLTKMIQESSKKSLFNISKEKTNTYITKITHFFKLSENKKQKLNLHNEEDEKGILSQTSINESTYSNASIVDDKKETTIITKSNRDEFNMNIHENVNQGKECMSPKKEDSDYSKLNENDNQGYTNIAEVKENPDNKSENPKVEDVNVRVEWKCTNKIKKCINSNENILTSKLIVNDRELDVYILDDDPLVNKENTEGMHLCANYKEEKNVNETCVVINDQTKHVTDNKNGNNNNNNNSNSNSNNNNNICNKCVNTAIKEKVIIDSPKHVEDKVELACKEANEMNIKNEDFLEKKKLSGENVNIHVHSISDKNNFLSVKKEVTNEDNGSYQNDSTTSQNSYEKKETVNGYNGSDQNESTTSQNSYEKKETLNSENISDKNEFTISPYYDENNETLNSFIASEQNETDKLENRNQSNANNKNVFVKTELIEKGEYNFTVHINLTNKNDTSNIFDTTQENSNNYCKNEISEHIKECLDDEKIKKIESLYKYCKEDINILLYIYVMQIYVNKLCKNVIVKVLSPKCKNVRKKKYPDNDFILTPLIGYSYANYYYLKLNKRNSKIKTESTDERNFKLINNTLITKKRRKRKKKRGRKKKLIIQNKPGRKRKNIYKNKNDLLSATYRKSKRSRLIKISTIKNSGDTSSEKAENIVKCTTKYINFYLWGIYNWNYNKTLRVSFNNISNKKISNFDIYNFFFYNYDTISNLNEINKDLSTLINIYKNVRTILYQNSSIYGNLFLLKPMNNMTRTHSDEELIKFWLKTLNELSTIREGFCKFF
ncbi:hypothetical protein, conserved [Plasmodium gonderi]|uniref:Uncharacterized protein n=1 Tax=Plasmodium gonderi TaxID=77519 RepID=A0A1Y1JKY5_PLAGO|nr:hypothetical protein, conserved [Plasmodium gonderi]GAW83186.1 hypothetical protein, conserved [Plasmodium gonderi]